MVGLRRFVTTVVRLQENFQKQVSNSKWPSHPALVCQRQCVLQQELVFDMAVHSQLLAIGRRGHVLHRLWVDSQVQTVACLIQ